MSPNSDHAMWYSSPRALLYIRFYLFLWTWMGRPFPPAPGKRSANREQTFNVEEFSISEGRLIYFQQLCQFSWHVLSSPQRHITERFSDGSDGSVEISVSRLKRVSEKYRGAGSLLSHPLGRPRPRDAPCAFFCPPVCACVPRRHRRLRGRAAIVAAARGGLAQEALAIMRNMEDMGKAPP